MIKKVLLFLCIAVFLLTGQVFAGDITAFTRLDDSAGTALTDYALTSGSAVYSETLDLSKSTSLISLLVVEDIAGAGGDVDISIEYSVDGTNFYDAYTSDMNGTITVVGNIVTALGNATRWIVITPRIAPKARIKFDPDANSEITVDYIFQYSN